MLTALCDLATMSEMAILSNVRPELAYSYKTDTMLG